MSGNDDIDYNKDVDFQPSKDSTTKLLETWRNGQVYLNVFWKVWKDEYLLSLREKISLYHKSSNRSQMLPKTGDVVLVKDDNLPRAAWKLGKILDLVQGRDGKVRSAEVLLPGHTKISRASNCLYPLEMPICEKETDDKSSESSSKQQVYDETVQQVDDETVIGEKKARQAIYHSLKRSGAATILFVSPGMS